MSIIMKLPYIFEEGKKEYEAMKSSINYDFKIAEEINLEKTNMALGKTDDRVSEGILANGDNLAFMGYLLNQSKDFKPGKNVNSNLQSEGERIESGAGASFKSDLENLIGSKIDLVYIDPPFFSKADYSHGVKLKSEVEGRESFRQKAYKDTWKGGFEGYLTMLVSRFLGIKDLMADTGSLWVHLDWHASHYVKIILDEIFGAENFLNEIIWDYKSGGACKNHFSRKHDILLFYQKTKKHYFLPLREKSYNRGLKPYKFKGVIEHQDEIGWYTEVNMRDVWKIDMVGRTSKERTGYATQKPEALLRRIIESCTKEGDVCADFYGGSGTLACVASKMGRRFISCDKGKLASLSTQKRMLKVANCFSLLIDNKSENLGKLHITAKKESKKYCVELLSYEFPKNIKLPIDDKNLQQIEEMQRSDSLQFVEYWSIDTKYDEVTFKPQTYFLREKNNLECNVIWEAEDFVEGKNNVNSKEMKIAVRAVDIFGNSSFETFTVK